MLQPVTYHYPSTIQAINLYDLQAQVQRVLSGDLIGIVIASHCDAFDDSIQAAHTLGLNADEGVPVIFNYERSYAALASHPTVPQGHEWADFGVTPFHADSNPQDSMVSICRIEQGSCEIRIFERAAALHGVKRDALSQYLQNENARLLLEETIDNELLSEAATCLKANEGDLLIFNPQRPHIGVTTQAPRRSASIFFWR